MIKHPYELVLAAENEAVRAQLEAAPDPASTYKEELT